MKTRQALQRELKSQLTLLNRASAFIAYTKLNAKGLIKSGEYSGFQAWLDAQQDMLIDSWMTK